MKVSNEMIARLKEVAEELYYDYEVVAIRVQDPEFELGEMDHKSHVWVDGDETDEELDGVCGIRSNMAEIVFNSFFSCVYPGEHVAIIAGNRYTCGEDRGEVIIEDPVVVEVLA